MTHTPPDLSDERVREIKAGCEGVTPFEDQDLMRYDHGGGRLAIIRDGKRDLVADFYQEADREHFGRLDPQTVSALCDLALEAIARRAADSADGWRPIETAPKDGRRVDLWVRWPEHDRLERSADAYWNAEAKEWQLGECHAGQFVFRPIALYWRPLPTPPVRSQHQGDSR